ncbi:hypothetical protein A9320_23215 [Ruegeria sp. PBVC088]|uniref:carph-isopro domain-containing protein n=1 Tax=Mameliella sp. AT18 TaxID=3028385 RepID=UPI0008410AA2|nr:hypothetical protein A9320_23215 [Ruegeria sp. PBVC088]
MEILLNIWPSISELAKDLGEPYSTVQSWRHRGIPARRYPQLIEVAKRRGADLTYEELVAANRGESAALSAASQGDAPAGGSLASEGTT